MPTGACQVKNRSLKQIREHLSYLKKTSNFQLQSNVATQRRKPVAYHWIFLEKSGYLCKISHFCMLVIDIKIIKQCTH